MQVLLYLVAFVLLLAAAFSVGLPRVVSGWLGLAVWLLAAKLLPILATLG